MKKTTKILLVLAAVVAMTIGAVSTVMAADDVVISEWVTIDAAKNLYGAKDQNGETIARGWAVSEAGRWYFFDSGKMLFNTFITYNQEIYYLDGTGCMASDAWVGFDKDANNATFDTKVNTVDKYIKNSYDKITDIDGFNGAFEIVNDTKGDVIFVNPLEDGKDKVLWCYFLEDGTMAQNEWVQAFDGLWYYIAGAYCVLGDYSVSINGNTWEGDTDFKDSVDGVYGFGPDGAQLYGWNYYDKPLTAAGNGSETDKDTPYYGSTAGTAATSIRIWTYYDMQTGMQVNRVKDDDIVLEGWEKIDGNWCYFIADADLGMKLLQNTMLKDTNAAADGLLKDEVVDNTQTTKQGYFYLDENGYMVTGVRSFAKDFIVNMWDEGATLGGTHKFTEAATFTFDTTLGKMLDGIQGRYYYNHATSQLVEADVVSIVLDGDITTSGSITINSTGRVPATYEGQRVAAKNFFLVTKDVNDLDGDNDKTDTVVLYFEHGVWQKNQAISFGEVTIGINANGAVIEAVGTDGKVKVAGYTYVASGLTLTVDGRAIIGLKK
ncbi:MAG: hypothetical protein E7261_02445 [Lachnospiraceae bacterium]|nr:hypothetical protein [Lachnospiraceae bacterium]